MATQVYDGLKLDDGTILNTDGTVDFFSATYGQRIRTHMPPEPDLLELPENVRSQVVHHLTDSWGNLWLDEVDCG